MIKYNILRLVQLARLILLPLISCQLICNEREKTDINAQPFSFYQNSVKHILAFQNLVRARPLLKC